MRVGFMATISMFSTKVSENIRQNLPNTITTKWLAMRCGVSVYQLNRLFKNHFQQTPMEFVWNERVKFAMTIIESDPSVDLGHVAKASGFRHQSHLSRLFKTRMGETPSQFRRVCRKHRKFLPQQLLASSDQVS